MHSQVCIVLFTSLLTAIVNGSEVFSHGAGVCVVLVAARVLAFVGLCLNMSFDMLSSITTVIESFWTAFIATGVGFLPSMCPHMQSHVLNT